MNAPSRDSRAALALAALGVVYGDIGTSPLYTIKAVFNPDTGVPLQQDNLLGAVSVIVWGLMFVVTLKYVILILRADHRGEGGIMALTALAAGAPGATHARRLALVSLGIIGAALFYGDGVITPAISVLSAVEGLEVATPALQPYVVPISLAVLIGLFAVQRLGTGRVGRLFGPLIALWFVALAVAGVAQIVRQPAILAALNPWHAVRFVHDQGWHFVAVLGSIALAFTGAEALYADLGHFGKGPIRMAWIGLALPALALNYMGQGALLMRDPEALANPFFHLFPPGWVVPVVMLATAATIIASQAVITGAFSMTQQAIQLGLLPRMQLRHTSAREIGQVYLPLVNWTLLGAVILALVGFRSSAALASAYGIAVTATMLATTLLTFFVVLDVWKYPRPVALGATALFLAVDLLLVAACALKFLDGGWFPIAIGIALFTIMSSWRRGRELLRDNIASRDPGLTRFLQSLAADSLPRAAGRTAVYPVRSPDTVPEALLHNLRHNRVLHERNVILSVAFLGEPWVPEHARVRVRPIAPGFWCVQVNYGFKDTPDIPHALGLCAAQGLRIDPGEASYFLSRETVIPTPQPGMALWREHLFALMSRNAASAADFLRLPSNCVIELGTRVCI